MTNDRNTGEVISLDQAIEFTHSYQEQNPNAIKAFFVGSDKVNSILEQENCMGIRMYNGYDVETQSNNLVLVGVDENGEDMTNGVIVEHLNPCPPDCPKNSSLIKR